MEYLCLEPSLVVVGRSIGELMREEIHTGKPITDIVDEEATRAFQKLLAGLRDQHEEELEKALANVKRIIGSEKRRRNRHKWQKGILVKRLESWQKSLKKPGLVNLRSKPDSTIIRLLAEWYRAEYVRDQALRDKAPRNGAAALALAPGVYSHAISALDALALDWLARGGLDGAKPERISNDFFDLDYVVSATFGSGLLTRDQRAKRVYKYLMKALERRYSKIQTASKTAKKKKAKPLADE